MFCSCLSSFISNPKQKILVSFPVYLLLFLIPFLGNSQEELSSIPGIDFSYAGYAAGEKAIPSPPAVLFIKPTGKDDTALLQAAIDHVATFSIQKNGFRGAIVLAPGKFQVQKPLQISASGIVIRGTGRQETSIIANTKERISLINIGKENSPKVTPEIPVIDDKVPAGSLKMRLKSSDGLKEGDHIVIIRPSNEEWITSLGMDSLSGTFAELRFHWQPGSRNLIWDRKIKNIDKDRKLVTLDAPITTALEQGFGGGTVAKVSGNKPLINIGIENLLLESDFNKENPKDEEHAWFGVSLNNVEDAWVRSITARHFVSSAVRTGFRARRISVINCHSAQPVSEIGGYRRLSFLTEGQQVLVRDCTSDSGINDFATGALASGPNVFLKCRATNALGASGTYESWAAGVLYEEIKIEGDDLRLTYDIDRTQAGGWTAANSVIWNSTAKTIEAKGPEPAPVVEVIADTSLYRTQLWERTGNESKTREDLFQPPQDMPDVPEFTVNDIPAPTPEPEKKLIPLKIVNGRFVTGNTVAWGGAVNDAWWLGQTTATNALDAGRSITRYVPGKKGPGLTEDLPEFAREIIAQGTPFYQSGPAIWYDRRRDDHSIVERKDANVWAAFYELPWARSGRGKAWDGLSKYDLKKYNRWYFERTKDFAELADENGIILYHHLYNNHNLLETASHWVDSPWRPANNINSTGLPEPPPLEPNDRIHIANEFYDVNNPKLMELHRAYILHALDELGHFENTIFGLSFQYSGPLEFQQFFQKTVAEWEKENDRKVRLVIATGKNITDAILADPELSEQISVIDMRYWHYLSDGSLWAPEAGQNLAFRELHPKEFGDPTTPQQVYRQVREYHDKYPDKAIVSWHSGVNPVPALMAGGAQVLMRNPTAGHGQGREVDKHPIDSFVNTYLENELMDMQPVDNILEEGDKNWMLANKEYSTVLIYSLDGNEEIKFSGTMPFEKYEGIWFDPVNGRKKTAFLPDHLSTSVEKPTKKEWLLLLKKAE